MNRPNVNPLTTTHDAGLNTARKIIPDASPATIALAAIMMNRGLLTASEVRDAVMRARAISR